MQSSGNPGDITNPCSVRRLSFRIRAALLTAVLALTASLCLRQQQQKLPDAPAPQNNAPVPSVNVPPPDQSGRPGFFSSVETRSSREILAPAPTPGQTIRSLRLRLAGDQDRSAGQRSEPAESGRDELFSLTKNVSFVTVPVTVKDNEGKLVDGLLAKDFTILENGIPQKLTFFTSDPFPLSAALIIDQGLPDRCLRKINQTFAALGGAFGPFDEVAVFTYGNTVNKRQDFGNSTRMELALQRI